MPQYGQDHYPYFYPPQVLYAPPDPPGRRPRRGLAALAAAGVLAAGGFVVNHFDLFTTVGGYYADHGGRSVVCDGVLGQNGVCLKVDSGKAEEKVANIVRRLSSGDDESDVYSQSMNPEARNDDDKATWVREFAPADVIMLASPVAQVGRSNSYQVTVEVINDKNPDDIKTRTSKTHDVKHDYYTLTMKFTLSDQDDPDSLALTQLPSYERTKMLGTSTAPRVEFIKKGYYYNTPDDLDSDNVFNTHEHDGGLAVYCMWYSPDNVDSSGDWKDWDKVMLRTYAGWVPSGDVRFSSVVKMPFCKHAPTH